MVAFLQFGDQDYPLLSEMTLGDYLRFQTAIDPDHEFMVYPDRDLRWTYAEFNDRTDRLARGMLYIGMRQATIWASGLAISPTGSPSCMPAPRSVSSWLR